jgi:hypothetical protein
MGEVTSVGSAADDIQDEWQGLKEVLKHTLTGHLCHDIGIGG